MYPTNDLTSCFTRTEAHKTRLYFGLFTITTDSALVIKSLKIHFAFAFSPRFCFFSPEKKGHNISEKRHIETLAKENADGSEQEKTTRR